MFFTTFLYAFLALVGFVMAAPSSVHKGAATFFTPSIGACGKQSTSSDHIVAVSSQFFNSFPGAGANPNKNPICGKTLTVHFKGKSTKVTVVDSCPGCGLLDLDLSPAAFNDLASPDLGRIQVTWTGA
ncbi:loosenin [Irpex rosettiformis]|uniref:Loosenin n=1 Tax=Irpex rosettiformis TaxID=378272 RepID=A0ACB8UDB6_9APHY|nr:loosenin [Irpex rosettiformis]